MLKILHIDADAQRKTRMRDLVEACSQQMVQVDTAEEARKVIAGNELDLILISLELADGMAEKFLRELDCDSDCQVPVIVLTDDDSLEQRERLFALGVVDYILNQDISEDRFRRYFDALAAEDELSRFMRSLKVAVLDDSSVILKIVTHILALNGINQVRCFQDPIDMLESGERFDLYVVDIVVPRLSGEQVISRVRLDAPSSIILTMSKFSGERSLSAILLAGADDYIHKPFDAAGFITRVKVNIRSFLLKRRLERMAVTDGLTGLYNHKHSWERLEQECAKATRYKRHLSLAMIDIDDFKRINDTRGHRYGDEVLQKTSKMILSSLRSCDVVGRYGGEEFIVLFPETSLDNAVIAAEKIRQSVEDAVAQNGDSKITVSIGLAEFDGKESAGEFLSRSDAMLYEAKRKGKNTVAVMEKS